MDKRIILINSEYAMWMVGMEFSSRHLFQQVCMNENNLVHRIVLNLAKAISPKLINMEVSERENIQMQIHRIESRRSRHRPLGSEPCNTVF